jgi:hypothetical protein
MKTAPVRGFWRKHPWSRTGGWLVMGGLLLGLGYSTRVQAEKKPEKDKPATKKGQPKLPVPKKSLPKKTVTDVLVKGEGAVQVAYINEDIRKKWKETKITPSDRCTDYEFIRRASLDIVGRIAKPAEVKQYLSDPPAKRRSMLIERLLANDEYAKNWANIWSVWLMTRSGALDPGLRIYHEQMKVWLEEKFAAKDLQFDKLVTELLTATGKTNENQAVNYILAHLGEPIRNNPRSHGKFEMVPVTSRTTRLFLGVRTQCTQCHDHPFNDDAKQKQFWGINAFFRQVDAPLGRPIRSRLGAGRVLELVDNSDLNDVGRVSYERRNGLVLLTKPAFLDGSEMPELGKAGTRRKELAKFIVHSPFFAKAYVNRMWAHFMGRGFTKVVDDFGSEQNEVSHPELLERMAKDFAKYNHNPRDLIRWICNSQAYGLSSTANKTNDKEDTEPYFSRMLLKAMSPEQLFESLMLATGAAAAQNSDDKKKLKESWMRKLVVNFGDDEGNEATFNGTVVQALLLMNGDDINKAISDMKIGTVARVISSARSHRAAMQALYMAALNRAPTAKEYSRMLSNPMVIMPRVRKPADRNFWNAFYQDLFWALLNSNEFILNH